MIVLVSNINIIWSINYKPSWVSKLSLISRTIIFSPVPCSGKCCTCCFTRSWSKSDFLNFSTIMSVCNEKITRWIKGHASNITKLCLCIITVIISPATSIVISYNSSNISWIINFWNSMSSIFKNKQFTRRIEHNYSWMSKTYICSKSFNSIVFPISISSKCCYYTCRSNFSNYIVISISYIYVSWTIRCNRTWVAKRS